MADSVDTTIASRRSLLRGLAVAPAAAAAGAGTGAALVTIPSAPAAPTHPDAGLLAIHREWRAAAAQEDRCCQEVIAAEKRLKLPPLPDAMRVRDLDPNSMRSLALRGGERHEHYPPRAVQSLRHFLMREGVTSPLFRSRAQEIITAADAHEAAVDHAHDACGHTAADAAWRRTWEAEKALRRALAAMPAKTLAGVQAKVDAATWLYEGDKYLEEDLTEKLKAEHLGMEALQASILRDLARMGRAGAPAV